MRSSEFIIEKLQLPKNKWELLISDADKHEVGNDLINLVHNAYSKTKMGSFIKGLQDVIPSDWVVINWDDEPDVDATIFYRANRPDESWQGKKIQGLGHDGTRISKDKAIQKIQEMLSQPGCWMESSDAMRAIMKRLNQPAVTGENFLRKLLNDPALRMIDTDTYTRTLSNGTTITETVFGHPILKGSQ